LHTPNGHLIGEVTSAMQKAIRRGKEREALYWATELDLAGFGNYVFKRLKIIASEDVGIADPNATLIVRSLYDSWTEARKNPDEKDKFFPRLFLIHAVIVLARAPKSRIVDHALIVMYQGDREPLEVPDYAYDHHTAKGKRLGRGADFFFDVATVLVNKARFKDPYEAEARAAHNAFLSEKRPKSVSARAADFGENGKPHERTNGKPDASKSKGNGLPSHSQREAEARRRRTRS
jgi:replication-associated recombination protein RarA